MSFTLTNSLKLKVLLVPKQIKEILFILKQFSFLVFKDIFLFTTQLGRKHKSVVELLLNMFPI